MTVHPITPAQLARLTSDPAFWSDDDERMPTMDLDDAADLIAKHLTALEESNAACRDLEDEECWVFDEEIVQWKAALSVVRAAARKERPQ